MSGDATWDRTVLIVNALKFNRSAKPAVRIGALKRIVERHGGEIWVDSTPGGGSTFRFTLRPGPPSS